MNYILAIILGLLLVTTAIGTTYANSSTNCTVITIGDDPAITFVDCDNSD